MKRHDHTQILRRMRVRRTLTLSWGFAFIPQRARLLKTPLNPSHNLRLRRRKLKMSEDDRRRGLIRLLIQPSLRLNRGKTVVLDYKVLASFVRWLMEGIPSEQFKKIEMGLVRKLDL